MSITTITTTTVVAATNTAETAAAFGAIGTCILILALIVKELCTAYDDRDHKPTLKVRLTSLAGGMNIAIVPMLILFVLCVVEKVMAIL